MPDVTQIETAFRQELVTAGLVRRPTEASPSAPPMHIEPLEGPPAPGEREGVEDDPNVVVTLRHSSEFSEAPGDSYRRRVVLDIIYRSRRREDLRTVYALDDAIRDRIVNRADFGLGWTMGAAAGGGVYVLQSLLYSGITPLEQSAATGYRHIAKYLIETHS